MRKGPGAVLAGGLLLAMIAVHADAWAATSGGVQRWASQWVGPSGGGASAMVVSPEGNRLYVTGPSRGPNGFDYETIAYSATTGKEIWEARYNGPNTRFSNDRPTAISLSSDGTRLFVTGFSHGDGTGYDWATLAYDATTGAELWLARYNAANAADYAGAIGVSPDGTRVYVTGIASGSNFDGATAAYDAASGALIWVTELQANDGRSLVVSPRGNRIYTSGYQTIAYDAATGGVLWQTPPIGGPLALTPNGAKLVVGGYGQLSLLDGASGHTIWQATLKSPIMAVAANARYVIAQAGSLTQSFDVKAGTSLWKRQFQRQGQAGLATALALNSDGAEAYVTGNIWFLGKASSFLTVAYEMKSGHREWSDQLRMGTAERIPAGANAIDVSPDGSLVFVAGGARHEFETVAYSAT